MIAAGGFGEADGDLATEHPHRGTTGLHSRDLRPVLEHPKLLWRREIELPARQIQESLQLVLVHAGWCAPRANAAVGPHRPAHLTGAPNHLGSWPIRSC